MPRCGPSSGRWPSCRSGPPNRTTCTCPTAPTTSRSRSWATAPASTAYRAGTKVVLLPTVPFGVNTNHLKIPGALACSVTPTTLLRLLTDLVDSLERQGLRKLVLLNGHGGNELKPLMRELHHRTGVFLCVCDWYRMAADLYPTIFDKPGEHADEVETSLGLAFSRSSSTWNWPTRARPGRPVSKRSTAAGSASPAPGTWPPRTPALGDPRAASADKGQRLMDALVERLARFLVELAAVPIDDDFPYGPRRS